MHNQFVIYGANGYTGALIAREAAARGQRPILAGRNAAALAALAGELGLDYRAVALDDAAGLDNLLDGVTRCSTAPAPLSTRHAPWPTPVCASASTTWTSPARSASTRRWLRVMRRRRPPACCCCPASASTSHRRTAWPRT
jgi:short subunit dehydrogenase-like uncharacterized protein